MRQSERASIFRVASDLIKADAIIDMREIEVFDSIREKYAIKKEDEVVGLSYTLEDAVNKIQKSSNCLQNDLMSTLNKIAMSDKFCAREEALLLISLQFVLSKIQNLECRIISVDTSCVFVEPTQILYVESYFDNDINWEINEKYREITSEVRLAGFDFVYLPKIAEHYRTISNDVFLKIADFLYPNVSKDRLDTITKQLYKLSTSEFCKDQLAGKLGMKEFSSVPPSLMIKIGESVVAEKNISNFMLVELDKNVVSIIRNVFDAFSEYYHNISLNYLKEGKGRFIFTGLYKQVFDLYVLRKGIKSSVVVDVYREKICFPEAGMNLEKLHRREKALYALFLLESRSGGINFTKPATSHQLEKYERRMEAVQKKYRMIYKKFGGDPQKAPNLSISEIRLPMIALIKKQLKAYNEVLYHVDDYMIQRNMFGNYCVSISPSLCCCCGVNANDIYKLSDSEDWQNISAL